MYMHIESESESPVVSTTCMYLVSGVDHVGNQGQEQQNNQGYQDDYLGIESGLECITS